MCRNLGMGCVESLEIEQGRGWEINFYKELTT